MLREALDLDGGKYAGEIGELAAGAYTRPLFSST
jgi:hypothetical protein